MNNMTWHCQLILQNNEDYYDETQCIVSHVMNKVYHDHNGNAFADQNRVRVYILAKFIRNYVEEITDAEAEHGVNNQMTQEIICGALQEISFKEIAEDLIGSYSPKSPAEVAEYEEYFNIRGFGNCDCDIDED